MQNQVILLVVFLAFIGLSYQQSCTNPTYTCNVALNQTCNSTNVCAAGSYCDYTSKVCLGYGTIGQNCSQLSYTDCQNVTYANLKQGVIACTNGQCLLTAYQGVGDNCTQNYTCTTASCVNGTCAPPTYLSTTAYSCGYGSFYNSTNKTCSPILAVGASCTADEQCGNYLVCSGGVCSKLFGGSTGATCKTGYECSSCGGCSNSTCTGSISTSLNYSNTLCQNQTSCQVGQYCVCNGTNTVCASTPVLAYSQCSAQFTNLASCYDKYKCAPVTSLSPNSFISYTFQPPSDSCLYNCLAQIQCVQKCFVDVLTLTNPNPGKFCGSSYPTLTCSTAYGSCYASTSTTSGTTSTSTTGGTTATSTGGTTTTSKTTGGTSSTTGGTSSTTGGTSSTTGGTSSTASSTGGSSSTTGGSSSSSSPSSTTSGAESLVIGMLFVLSLFV